MSVGIDFILRANSSSFNKGLAQASNGIKGLRKELREGEVGSGIKRLLGAGAIIEGFRAVMNHAQEVRKSFEEMGKPIPENIRTISAMADGIDDLKNGLMSAGTVALGFFTGVGDKLGRTINELRNEFGGSKLDLGDGAEVSGRKAAELEADLAKARAANHERNKGTNLARQVKEIEEARHANEVAGLGTLEKRNALLAEEQVLITKGLSLREQASKTGDYASVYDNSLKLEKKTGEVEAAFRAEKSKHDTYLPTLVDLANAGNGQGFNGRTMDYHKVADAQRVMQLEAQAEQAGWAGKFDLSDSLKSQAGKLRVGLEGSIQSGDVDKGRNAMDKVAEGIEKLNESFTKTQLIMKVNK